jgi:predicted esterase YcpF (UPF0227 family)
MKRKQRLFIDQYGHKYFAKTIKELQDQMGFAKLRVTKMYRDKDDGRVVHVGYVIGGHWLTMYAPIENET